MAEPVGEVPRVPFRDATRAWAQVGLQSFGGPAGQIAVMHRELVDERGWVEERRFLHALNFCMLLPGPEAMQLSVYLGWVLNGVRGGVVAGTLFVLPGLAVMMVIAGAYAAYGSVGAIAALLAGVQAAVVAVVAQALVRIGGRALRTRLLKVVAVTALLAMALFGVAFPVVVVAALVLGWLVGRRRPETLAVSGPDDSDVDHLSPLARRRVWGAAAGAVVLWLLPVVLLLVGPGPDNVLTQQAWLFSKVAVVSFGGAYAALAYVSQQAVASYGWISSSDMVAGLGLAETTPGPLVLVLPFVGFVGAYGAAGDLGLSPLAAGLAGGLLTAWVTFLPSFAFVFAGAPFVERLRHDRRAAGALAAVTGSVVGVIANLALWFAGNVLFGEMTVHRDGPFGLPTVAVGPVDWTALVLVALSVVVVFWQRWGVLRVLGLAALLSVGLSLLT